MDYMELVNKSARIGWRYRFLWLFGFFVSIADGLGGGTWWSDKADRYGDHSYFGRFDNFSFDLPEYRSFRSAQKLWHMEKPTFSTSRMLNIDISLIAFKKFMKRFQNG